MNAMFTEYSADPNISTQLAQVIVTVKKAEFSKSFIELTIVQNQDIFSSGAALKTVTLEAIMSTSVTIIIDCQTDSKVQILSAIQLLILKHEETVTSTSYLFRRKNKIVFEHTEDLDVDEILDEVIKADVMNIEENEQS